MDCDNDKDCKKGLFCAEAHKKELIAFGLNKRKAYCGDVGTRFDEVCYNPALVPNPKIKECEVNCFTDSDCEEYLLCGRTNKDLFHHSHEYMYGGDKNSRDAYCGDVAKDNEYDVSIKMF